MNSPLFFRILLEGGASRHILTDQGERPIDLVDPGDARMIQVMLSPLEKKRWKKYFVKINQFHHITPYFWSSTRRSPLTYADLIVSVFVACGDFTKENTQNNWNIAWFLSILHNTTDTNWERVFSRVGSNTGYAVIKSM